MDKNTQNIETLKIELNSKLPPPKIWDEKKIWSFGYHKVILGYLNAFFDHCPIIVNPNIIWQLIVNGFSECVDKNSESLRDKIVDFKGKKLIKIEREMNEKNEEFLDSIDDEDGIIEEYCEKIKQNTKNNIVDILTPNFSTSIKSTIIASKISIMAVMKKYFDYELDMDVMCGIPYIILEGTLKDWESILEKLKQLSNLNEYFYSNSMQKVLEKIIETKKGNIDKDFWRKIIMETEEDYIEYKPCSDEIAFSEKRKYIKGWICNFYPYMKKTEIKSKDLPDEVIYAPFELVFKINGKEVEKKNVNISAGITNLKQDKKTGCVEPIINWYIDFHSRMDFDF